MTTVADEASACDAPPHCLRTWTLHGTDCQDERHRGRCAIKRLAANLGEAKLEGSASFRNAALVAISRVRTSQDLAFSSPVTSQRLAVCGSGKAAEKLKGAMEHFRRQAARCEAELAVVEAHYDAYLAWAVDRARRRGHDTMPWERAEAAATDANPSSEAATAMQVDGAAALM